jgi:hypothetical protein
MPMLFASLSDAEMQQLDETLAARGYPGGTKELAAEARDWIKDCQWVDLDEDAIGRLPDTQALSGIARKYDGGLDAFIGSCGYPPGSRF